MKTLIDANVILRYLLNDDESMSIKAKEIIDNGSYTLTEIIAEVVYVLKGVYHVEKQDITLSLASLLNEVEIENREVVLFALTIYANKNLDFVDCLLVARHKIFGEVVFTFDKKLNKVLNQSA